MSFLCQTQNLHQLAHAYAVLASGGALINVGLVGVLSCAVPQQKNGFPSNLEVRRCMPKDSALELV